MTQEIKTGKYLYRLGHQPHIGTIEYNILAGETPEVFDNWLYCDKFLSPNQTGSLVFVSQITAVLPKNSALEGIEKAIQISLNQFTQGIPKKIGLSGLAGKEFMKILKNSGCKKINQITDLPGFGHWKQTHNWILAGNIGNNLVFSIILEYADQQFWRYLDETLPAGEMSRGLMNLKLARTLLNFTTKKIVMDPFAGFGRLAVAGLDIKDEFLLSDIDGEDLAEEVSSNLKFAESAWIKYFKHHHPDKDIKLARFEELKTLDAINLDQTNIIWPKLDYQNTAMVTEGFLGTNFNKTPQLEQIEDEFNKLKTLWSWVLEKSKDLKIPEIIFCLPAYKLDGKFILADWIAELTKDYGYKNIFQNPIVYSRKDSFVGHQIIFITR